MQFVQLIQAFSSNAKKLLYFGLFAISALFISFWFSNDALAATTDSMMVYDTQTIVSTPKYRVWDGSAWGGESSASTVNGEIAFQEVKYSPTRDEAILIIQTTTGEISAQVFNGSTWGSPTVFGTITGNGIGPDVQTLNGICFDFFYEQTSGDAIAVYCDNSADPDYRVWNGTTWAGAVNIDIPTTGIISAIETAHRPGADEGAFITRDANSDVYGMRWTGSAWSNMAVATTWETTASLATKKPIDVQFEKTSGDIMFAWGFATVATAHFRYRTYTQSNSTLNAVTNVTNANNGGVVHWMKLSPDSAASSDKIMIGLLDAGADLNTFEWSGSAWSAVHTEHSGTTEDVVDMNFDLTYETHASNPSDVWMTYGNSTTVTRKKWDAGAWGTATTAGDDTAHTKIIAQPNNGAVLAAAYEDNTSATDDLLTFQITGGGTTWSGTSAAWAGPVGRNLGFFRTSMAAQGYNSSNEAMMVYDTQAMVTTPKYRVWNGSAWGGEQNAQNVNGDTLHMRLEFSPTRDEAILITYGSTGDIQAQTWNGSAWATPQLIGNYTGNGIGPDLQATTGRAFDFKYENTSGDAVVVYADNTADPNYKVWNGTTWSGANNIDIATTGQTNWIKMADSRVSGSDNLAFISIDANVDIYGMSWNGSAWDDMNSGGVEAVWDATASVATRESITVNYEKTSGDLMFVWGDGTATTHLNYRTYVGTTLSAVTTLANANQGGVAHWVRSAADPTAGSNKILIGEVDAGGDLNTFEWSGTAWGAVHTEHSATVEDIVDRNFDIVYETHATNAGDAWIAWGDGATVTRKKWDAGVWGTSTTAGDDTALSVLFAHPDTGAVHLAVYEDNTSATDDILTWQLTSGGTTWSGSSSVWGGPVARNLAVIRVDISSERYSAPVGITVSGVVYQVDESTPDGTGFNLSLSNGGGIGVTTTSNGSGVFTFSGVGVPTSGDVITIWITGGTYFGTLVFKYGTSCTGNPDCTGLALVRDQVRIDSKNGAGMAIADLATCDNNDGGFGCNSSDLGFDADTSGEPSTLTVSDGRKLRIANSVTFTPGGDLITSPSASAGSSDGDLVIGTGSTLNIAGYNLQIGGDFVNSGTFSESGAPQATTFTATATGHNIDLGTGNFDNVLFNGVGGGWSFGDASNTIAGDITISNGTLSGTTNLTVNGGDVTGAGALSLTAGTLTIDGAGNFGGTPAWNVNGLTLSGSGTSTTMSAAGTVTVVGDLSVGASHTLNGTGNITVNSAVGGTGIITRTGGTFIHNMVGTQNFGDSGNWTFNDLTFNKNGVSGTATANGAGSVTVNGILAISAGTTLSAGSKTWISSTCDYQNSGTFTVGTSTFSYRCESVIDIPAGNYYNLDFSPPSSAYYDLNGTYSIGGNMSLGGAGNVVVGASNYNPIVDINGDVSIGSGDSFDGGATATITVGGAWINAGTFTHNSGTIIFDSNDAANIDAGGSYFNNATFNHATGDWTLTGDLLVNGVLTISNGNLNASSRTITLSGSGTPFVKSGGTFTQGTSTVVYALNGAQNITALNGSGSTDAYYNLEARTSILSDTKTILGNTTVKNVITIGSNNPVHGLTTLDLGAHTLTLNGSGTPIAFGDNATGRLNSNTGTVVYSSASGVAALSGRAMTGSNAFYNLTVNGTGTFTAGVVVEVQNDLAVSGGTLAMSANNLSVGSSAVSNSGDIKVASGQSLTQSTGGTTYMYSSASGSNCIGSSGASCVGTAGTITLGSLYIGDSTTTVSSTLGGSSPTITILDVFRIRTNATFNAGSGIIVLSQTGGTPFSLLGTFSADTSTINYTGGNATTITPATYFNLGIKPGANGATHTMGSAGSQAFVVGGVFTAGNGTNTGAVITAATYNPTIDINGTGTSVDIKANTTFIAPANTFTVAGSWLNAGTFTSSGATVTLDAGSGSKTITSGGSSFGSLTLGGNATFTPQDTLTLTANLNVNSGTLAGTQNINVGSSVSGDGDINLTGGTFTITTGGVFGGTGIAWDFNNLSFGGSSNITTSATGSSTIAGVLSVGGLASFDAGDLDWILAGSGTPLTFGASASFTSNTSKFTYTSPTGITALSNYAMTEFGPGMYYDLEINYAATFNTGVAIQVYNSLTVTTGTLAVGFNAITICTALQGEANEACSLNVAQAGTITQNDSATTTFFPSKGSNCIGASEGVCAGNIGTVTLGDVVLTSGGVLAVGTAIGGNTLTIDTVDVTGATLDLGNAILNITGNGTIVNGTQFGGVVSTGTGTINLISNATTGTTVPDISYYNLVINKASNTFTAPTNLVVNRNLTISAGTLVAPSGNLTVYGDLTNNGTFNANSGTVIIYPNFNLKSSTVGGANNITFNNFTANASNSTVRFQNGKTFIFNGTFTATGTSGNPVKLVSDTLGVQWLIDINGSTSLLYVGVRDGGCSSSALISTATKVFNLGNNDPACWKFIKRAPDLGGSGPDGGGGSGGAGGGGGGQGGGGSGQSQATGTATISGGIVQSVEVNAGGSGYFVAPLVCAIGVGEYTAAALRAVVGGGAVTNIFVDNGGSGYSQGTVSVSIGAPGTSGGTCSSGGGGGGAGGGGGGSP